MFSIFFDTGSVEVASSSLACSTTHSSKAEMPEIASDTISGISASKRSKSYKLNF